MIKQESKSFDAASLNMAFYNKASEGRRGYWRYMAAPILRRRRILQAARRFKPASVCDFGCGDGSLLLELAGLLQLKHVVGIDLSRSLIEENRKRMPNFCWQIADLSGRGFVLESGVQPEFGISCEVIEHVENPLHYLKNIFSALKSGGYLFLSTQSGRLRTTERQVGHIRHFSVHEIKTLLQAAGFVCENVWNEGFPFHDFSKYWANRNPKRTMEKFGNSMYGPSQKMVCLILRFLFLFNSKKKGNQLFAIAKKNVEQS